MDKRTYIHLNMNDLHLKNRFQYTCDKYYFNNYFKTYTI